VVIGRIVFVVALASFVARAAVFVEYEERLGPELVSDTAQYPLIVERPDSTYAVDVQAVLREGSGVLRITDPNGAEIYRHLWGDRISQELAPLGPLDVAGEYHVVVDVEGALGHWRVRVAEVPDAAQLRSIALAGPLLGLVGLAFLLAWRFGTHAQWRWFAVGGGARIAAAAFALAVVLVYHFTVRGTLGNRLPYARYLILDGGVIGVASGIAAVLAFLIAGYMFRGSRKNAPNAIALGVGAGVIETLVSSIVTIMGTGLLFGNSPKSEKWMLQLAYDATLTPLLPLVEPAKFICVILCLMATGGLALMAIAARRRGLLFPAFLLASGFYAVLGAAPVWALEGAASKWWILSGALPFAITSVFVVRWCLREWPPDLAPDEVPMEEFLRESSAVERGR
jgi:hypothetical protein